VFPRFTCGLLHGRMPAEEKERALLGFKNNDIQVLVSTTVIEVGVDVPNATVMLIEHGERFGLAQLHQLRGRIGRGADNATCICCVKTPLTYEASRRLKAITSTTDGFRIAELDLEIRGPGEFLGTRQHGLPHFKIADLLTDTRLLVAARDEAFRLIDEDPTLQHPRYAPLRNHLKRQYRDKLDLIKIG